MAKRGDDGRTFIEAARRAQLVRCAIEVIAERGYPGTTIGQIAERAGVSRGLVPYHFADKDELVALVVAEVYTAAVGVMLPAISAQRGAAAKLATYIRSNGAFIAGHRQHALALLDIWTSYRTAAGERLDQVLARSGPPPAELADLDPARILQSGVDTGEFGPIPVAATAIALRQAIDGAVLQTARDPAFDIAGYAEDIVTIFARATRPGVDRSDRGDP